MKPKGNRGHTGGVFKAIWKKTLASGEKEYNVFRNVPKSQQTLHKYL